MSSPVVYLPGHMLQGEDLVCLGRARRRASCHTRTLRSVWSAGHRGVYEGSACGRGLFSRTRRRGVDPNPPYGHAPPHGASPSTRVTGAGTDEPVSRVHRAVLSACSSSPEDRRRALACMLRRWSVTVHVHEQSGMPGPRMRHEGDWSRGEPLIKKVIPRVSAGCRVEQRLFESLDGESAGVLGIECGRGRWKKDCPAAGRVDGSFWSQ